MTPEDFEKRIFDNFDYLRDKVDDLCDRTTRTEEKLDSHLTASDKRDVSRKERVYWVLGIAGSLIVLKLSEMMQ